MNQLLLRPGFQSGPQGPRTTAPHRLRCYVLSRPRQRHLSPSRWSRWKIQGKRDAADWWFIPPIEISTSFGISPPPIFRQMIIIVFVEIEKYWGIPYTISKSQGPKIPQKIRVLLEVSFLIVLLRRSSKSMVWLVWFVTLLWLWRLTDFSFWKSIRQVGVAR